MNNNDIKNNDSLFGAHKRAITKTNKACALFILLASNLVDTTIKAEIHTRNA